MVNLIAASVDEIDTRLDFPHRIRVDADIRIPLEDGNWLHARLWIPRDAMQNPVPAVVEYAPFRHRDFTAPRDALIHPWFAGHGYASLRVELRGSGDSSGLPMDEYVRQEQDDALEALAWIAGQPWCDGNTGMFGMSWGAFSALQVAARSPPSLKAIIPVHGTDDRFADDIHYKGGCLLGAGLSWGTLYTLYMMRPPDPEISGTNWRQPWLQRFDRCPLVLPEWMSHQRKDEYWRHGSISEDHSALTCPALVVCGWADGYTGAAMRMAERLPGHSRVVIGPWAHTYPHLAQPGPQAGFLQQAVNWWDRWLKGEDNGADKQPRLRLWMQQPVAPLSSYSYREGQWLAFDSWPSSDIDARTWLLQPECLADNDNQETVLRVASPLANAINGPEWLPHGVGPELPVDQQSEDSGSLCFDTAPLDSALLVCGAPVVCLKLRSNTNAGIVLVRLVDLLPDGKATQISYGLLNLSHRNGLDNPSPVPVNEWLDVQVPLNSISQRVPAGHRIRLSVSTQAWPLVWPAARNMEMEVLTGQSSLSLPLLDAAQLESITSQAVLPAAIPEPLALTWVRPVKRERKIEIDKETGATSRSYLKDDGAYRIGEHGIQVDATGRLTYRSRGDDPLSAEAEYNYRIELERGDWQAGVECDVRITVDAERFYLTGEYRAIEKGKLVRRREIDIPVERKFV